jgi:3-hydroxybutyryl-CoA dehydrogenase
MNIAVKGSVDRTQELAERLSSVGMSFTKLESTKNIQLADFDLIFDLNFDADNASLPDYKTLPANVYLVLSAVECQLEAVIPKSLWSQTLGMNALPTFINRNEIECCALGENDASYLKQLGWNHINQVASRVGLVSPRVVCMIINEAFYTQQEGTANAQDIDLGMKLGTAYPLGPFEWAQKIGIVNVYRTLSALYNDTHDERYKICSQLKTAYLKQIAQ